MIEITLILEEFSFEDVLKYVEGRVKSSQVRTVRTNLASDSNSDLSIFFNVSKSDIAGAILFDQLPLTEHS